MYNFGSHNIKSGVLDYSDLRSQCEQISQTSTKKSGLKDHNRFGKVTDSILKSKLIDLMTSITQDTELEWHFEYFHSGEPVGLHTDYTTVPWDDQVECQVVVGVIIPLEWNCRQPYTINYNRSQDIPRKLIYRRGEMRYTDTDEVLRYRDKHEHNPESLQYNPLESAYCKEYMDLEIHSVYQWQTQTCMLFDTRRWHSSSWFLSENSIPDVSTEYKRSIVGFGSRDVPTGTLDELLKN